MNEDPLWHAPLFMRLETVSLSYELMSCTLNENIGQLLLTTLQTLIPSLTSANILRLDFPTLDSKLHLPATLLIAVSLSTIWKERTTNSRVRAYQVRSELEQTINLLRTTRLVPSSEELRTMVGQMFN